MISNKKKSFISPWIISSNLLFSQFLFTFFTNHDLAIILDIIFSDTTRHFSIQQHNIQICISHNMNREMHSRQFNQSIYSKNNRHSHHKIFSFFNEMKEPKQMEHTHPEEHNQEPRSKQHIIENILCQLLSLYLLTLKISCNKAPAAKIGKALRLSGKG